MTISDQILNISIYALVLGGLLSSCVLLFAAYLLFYRPLKILNNALTEQLGDQQREFLLRESELNHDLSTLRHQLEAVQASLSTVQVEYKQEQNKCSQLSVKVASLTESLKYQDNLQAKLDSLQAELLKQTQINAKLEADLASEREQLQKQREFLQQAKDELKNEFELTANKLFERKSEQFSSTNKSLLEGTLHPFREQMHAFRKKVEDVYEKENAERNKLSGQIVELQKQAHKIGEDAVNLAQALKGSNKSQGSWGEVILERLLEQSGLQKGREYEAQFQARDDSGKLRIPDVVIHLPEGKDIIIDAKVSLVHYEKYCATEQEDEKRNYLQAHIASIRTHIKQLSAKDYAHLDGVHGLDFVFIFIPIEAAFMLALQNDASLYSDAYSSGVILTSPTTLLAILRTIESLWRHEKQNQNAEKIAKDAGALYDQFVLVLEALDKVGDSLSKSVQAYELAQKRLHSGRGNLIKRVETIKKLGAKTKKSIPDAHLKRLSSVDDDNSDGQMHEPEMDDEPINENRKSNDLADE